MDAFFCVFIFVKYEIYAYLARIFCFYECLIKRKFRVYLKYACIQFCEIGQNSQKFAKICTRKN